MENHPTQTAVPKPFRLSPEVVMHIMEYVNPIDIISMRKTCHLMCGASKLRAVWVGALEGVCENHGIFKPTYPMEGMSRLDLEHAALAPYRTIKLLKANAQPNLVEPYQTRIFRTRTSLRDRNGVYLRHQPLGIHVIPGGRFVFTHDRENFYLWDLGYNVNIPIKPSPIAVVNIAHREVIAISASQDGEAAILAFDAGTRLQIYEISPHHPQPTFKFRACLHYDNLFHEGCLLRLRGDTAYIWIKSCFIVWNWRDDMGCGWKVTSGPLSFEVRGSSIIFCEPQGFGIWDVPSLCAFQQTPRRVKDFFVCENPAKTFPRPNDGRHQVAVFSRPSWNAVNAASPNYYICFLGPTGLKEQVFLYSVRHIGRPDDCFLPSFLPVLAGKTGDANLDTSYDWAGAVRPSVQALELVECDGHLVFCSVSNHGGSLNATVMPIPKAPSHIAFKLQTKAFKLTEYDFGITFPNLFDFCPVSGRTVHLSEDNELHISDLLSIADGPA